MLLNSESSDCASIPCSLQWALHLFLAMSPNLSSDLHVPAPPVIHLLLILYPNHSADSSHFLWCLQVPKWPPRPFFLALCLLFTFPFWSTLPPSLHSAQNSSCYTASWLLAKLKGPCVGVGFDRSSFKSDQLYISSWQSDQIPGTLVSLIFLSKWFSCVFPISVNDSTFCLVIRQNNVMSSLLSWFFSHPTLTC